MIKKGKIKEEKPETIEEYIEMFKGKKKENKPWKGDGVQSEMDFENDEIWENLLSKRPKGELPVGWFLNYRNCKRDIDGKKKEKGKSTEIDEA